MLQCSFSIQSTVHIQVYQASTQPATVGQFKLENASNIYTYKEHLDQFKHDATMLHFPILAD